MHNPITVATTWAERGMPTFPIAISWDEAKQGTNKRPLTPHGHHDGSTDPDVVRDMFAQYGDLLADGEELGTGMRPEGYLVADCDRHGTGDGPAYADSIRLNGTWTADTASNGEHRYYSKPPGASYSNAVPEAWRGLIDVRADAGWVVAPGTQTSWGQWRAREPWDPAKVHVLPAHIAALLKPASSAGQGGWRRYRPERDNPNLHPLTVQTHEIVVAHHGADPAQTTIHDRADPDTGEITPYLQVTRPGKAFGVSGTIGFVGPGVLWVFTDSWPGLAANRAHRPDELAMRAAWRAAGGGTADPVDENPYGYLDWSKLWDAEVEDREDLIPGIWTVGAGGSIYSPAGAGKSLLGLEWAVCLALGMPILGEPVKARVVLYVDLENDEQLVRERLDDLGLHGVPIPNLHYSLLGDWPALDTPEGGAALLAEARRIGADLIIIDTTSRIISGEENNADTFLALYRHTMRPLKAAGIAVLRFDHSGKDLAKGERGSSAKRSDVDLTYQLTLTGENTVSLKREKNRLHLPGPDLLILTRQENPLRHAHLDKDAAHERRMADLIALLDQYDVPVKEGWRKAGATLRHYGHKVGNQDLRAAVGRRRNRPQVGQTDSGPFGPPQTGGPGGGPEVGQSGPEVGQSGPGSEGGWARESGPLKGPDLAHPPSASLTDINEPCRNGCGRQTVPQVQPCRPCQRGDEP